jgi:hypothetical protein
MSTVRPVIDGFVGTADGDLRLSPDDEYDTSDRIVAAAPHLFTEPEGAEAPKPVKKATRGKS